MALAAEWYADYKPLLFSIAHKMTGSINEAEDAVQDVFLRVHAEPQSYAAVSNPKAYLCKMVTNRCIDALKSARKKREVYTGPWLPEPILYDDAQDPAGIVEREERISYAFLVFLEELNPVERAIFVLREALDMDYKEVAEITDKSAANCRQIYGRTKAKLRAKHPAPPATVSAFSDAVGKLIHAITGNDLPALVRLLHEDVVAYTDGGGKVLAAIRPIFARNNVIAFLTSLYAKSAGPDSSFQIRRTDGGFAVLLFVNEAVDTVVLFDVAEGAIRSIYMMRNPDKLKHINI